MRNRTSNLRIPRSDALPLSHRDSAVSEAYYEVTGPPQITDGGSPRGQEKQGGPLGPQWRRTPGG